MLEASRTKLGKCSFYGGFLVDRCNAVTLGKIPFDLSKVCDCQGLCRTVVFGDLVQDIDGFLIAALTGKVSWALLEVEQEETREEGNKSDRAHGVHEVAPTHVVGFSALTRWSVCTAGIVRKETPGGASWNDLPNRPPDC